MCVNTWTCVIYNPRSELWMDFFLRRAYHARARDSFPNEILNERVVRLPITLAKSWTQCTMRSIIRRDDYSLSFCSVARTWGLMSAELAHDRADNWRENKSVADQRSDLGLNAFENKMHDLAYYCCTKIARGFFSRWIFATETWTR